MAPTFSTLRTLGPICSALGRSIGQSRCLSTTADTSRINQILKKQKSIPDYLSPTHSQLLTISLSDHIPAECLTMLPPEASPSLPETPASLPQGHHLVYFPIQARPSELHHDGTDVDHWPGPPFTRRMWAGGEVRFRTGWEAELPLDGRAAKCVETVEDVKLSGEGSKGKAFVDVWRRYSPFSRSGQREPAPAIEERRTLVFMPEAVASSETSPQARKAQAASARSYPTPDYSFTLTPTRALLANFSALTYNAHSIHLDTALTAAEGHRGLLVHGPLSLTLMFAALRGKMVAEQTGSKLPDSVQWLGYRNVAPLYCGEEMRVCLGLKRNGSGEADGAGDQGERRWDVWVEGREGRIAVKGTAVTGPGA